MWDFILDYIQFFPSRVSLKLLPHISGQAHYSINILKKWQNRTKWNALEVLLSTHLKSILPFTKSSIRHWGPAFVFHWLKLASKCYTSALQHLCNFFVFHFLFHFAGCPEAMLRRTSRKQNSYVSALP